MLQWVKTTAFGSKNSSASFAIALHASSSSAWMASASSTIPCAIRIAPAVSGIARPFARTRWIPHTRFTAVGRVAARTRPACSARSRTVFALDDGGWTAACATPIAPAIPSAGAPRTRSARIASATASVLTSDRYSSRPGNAVWSMTTMSPSRHSIDRIGVESSGRPRRARSPCARPIPQRHRPRHRGLRTRRDGGDPA